MLNLKHFYKRIFLHVIPGRIIVPWFNQIKLMRKNLWEHINQFRYLWNQAINAIRKSEVAGCPTKENRY